MQLTQVPSGLISRDHALLVASLLYIGLLALACLVPNAGAPLRTAALDCSCCGGSRAARGAPGDNWLDVCSG